MNGLRVWNYGDIEPTGDIQVRDQQGDIWQPVPTVRGMWTTRETRPAEWPYLLKKWGPVTEVAESDPDARVILRPNGKSYRPRKVVAYAWSNESRPEDSGVIILGTHDIGRATALARTAARSWFDACVRFDETGWFRLGYGQSGPQWVSDPVQGRAGCWFTCVSGRPHALVRGMYQPVTDVHLPEESAP